MENFYTLPVLASYAKKYAAFAALVILALFLLVFVRLNAEYRSFGTFHSDEYHTIHQGLNLFVNGSVDNFRAQESVRWLVRLFYPYALFYMNTHMGGNVFIDGWSYPGHNYVTKNFIQQNSLGNNVTSDPNLRLLFHALRQQYILFVAACVLSLFLFFLKKKYTLVAFGGVLLLGFSLQLLSEQHILYIEPGMVASLALLTLAYCYALYRNHVSVWTAILLGFLAAFMLATKLSTVLFTALPIILFIYIVSSRNALKYTGVYLISVGAFYVLINLPAFTSLSGLNLYLHDLFSNFWQYAAGSDSSVTVASGISHVGLLVYQLEELLGYALYVTPALAVFALWHADARERMVLLPLATLTGLSVVSLAGQHVYLPRNLVPFYLPIVLVVLLSLEIVARKMWSDRGPKLVLGGITLVLLMWLSGVVIHAGGVRPFLSELVPDSKSAFISELRAHDRLKSEKAWYSVGFSEHFFEGEDFEPRIVIKENAPSIVNNQTYPELTAEFNSLPKDAIVLVNNVGNNKHIAHYILPSVFRNNMQFGKYYIFFDSK